jgi:hypothetical protein
MKQIRCIALLFGALMRGPGSVAAQLRIPHEQPSTWSLGVIGGVRMTWENGSYTFDDRSFAHQRGIGGMAGVTLERHVTSRVVPELGVELPAGWQESVVKGSRAEWIGPAITGSLDTTSPFVDHRASLRLSSAVVAPSPKARFGAFFLGAGARIIIPVEARMAQEEVLTAPGVLFTQPLMLSRRDPDVIRSDTRVAFGVALDLGAIIPVVSSLSLVPRIVVVAPLASPLADDDPKLLTAEGLLGVEWAL